MPLIRASEVPSVADEAAKSLAPAFALSETETPEAWIERCRSDLAQLWRSGDFWAVTEVRNAKRGMVLHIVACAGVYCDQLLSEIEAWGKSKGVQRVYFTGRKGWSRRLSGFDLVTVTMAKEI